MTKGNDLAQKKCKPCEGGVSPLPPARSRELLGRVKGWELAGDGKNISARYVMKNFVKAVDLIRRIAEVAEADNHHPDLHLTGYRNLKVDLSTHAIGGLSENDFILAAKIDRLPKELKA